MVDVGGKGVLSLVGEADSGFEHGGSEACNSRGRPVGLLGVCREAVIRTAVIAGLLVLLLLISLSGGVSRSLLMQSVHANVSPTYAAPKLAGRVRRGVRGDEVDDGSVDGQAWVASGWMLRDGGLKEVAGRGVCVAKEGRERRRTFRERGCGVDDEDWLLDWAILVGFVK